MTIKRISFIKISIIFLIIIGILGTFYYKMYYVDEMVFFTGVKLNILVEKTEIIDHSSVSKEKMGNGAPVPWFDLWAESERNKLIIYMKENNLKIMPGVYEFNQSDRFEKVIDILKFEKK